MSYLFQNATAFDPYTGQGVSNASGQVFAMSDAGFTTPLVVTLLSSGLQTTELVSDQYSQLPAFDAGDNVQVRFRSGEFVKVLNTSTPLVGPTGDTGKSAYNVAVEGGYTGTEAEYNATMTDAPNLVARAETAETAAVNASNLVGAPADTAIATAINGPGTQTQTALHAAIGESAVVGGAVYKELSPLSVFNPAPKPPDGFRGLTQLPYPKIRRMMGQFLVDLALEALRPPAGVTYHTAPNAATGATGLDPANPMRLSAVLAKPDVGTVIVADGEYHRAEVSIAAPITRSINWIAAEGAHPKITGWNRVTDTAWTSTSGHIYQSSRSATASIVDVSNLTSWGDYTVYTKQVDLASIVAPGQWALVGSIVYVWAIGNTNLSVGENRAQLRLQVNGYHGVVATGSVHYVEGIDFLGCATGGGYDGGLVSKSGALVISKDCAVRYNSLDDGPQTIDGGHMISINTEASSNARDGFNYHNTLGSGGEFIEINCNSHHNGLATPGTNNASTAHEAVTGIRVNGTYELAGGPVVADVNSAHTWNLGCYAGGQAVTVSSSGRQSWRVDATGFEVDPAQQFLDECGASESEYAYGITGAGAKIHLHASGHGNPNMATAGSILTYYAR